ncbi:hypothetical protein P3T76_012687 [Phytophthora citrophthora]|uniref:Uncharacterized protein n=1 Tax=Phytophthora citrophthora TaxID=4793 RepID=A0AAD9G4Z1_9STRA|nr:hypothetical protein P3T76_012687 [Phytophthora citrophthora]
MDNAQIEVDWSPAQFGQWNSRPLVSHGKLRDYEQAFPIVIYSDGVPFVPWRTFERKMKRDSGGQMS